MADPREELEKIRQSLGDLPSRLASVLTGQSPAKASPETSPPDKYSPVAPAAGETPSPRVPAPEPPAAIPLTPEEQESHRGQDLPVAQPAPESPRDRQPSPEPPEPGEPPEKRWGRDREAFGTENETRQAEPGHTGGKGEAPQELVDLLTRIAETLDRIEEKLDRPETGEPQQKSVKPSFGWSSPEEGHDSGGAAPSVRIRVKRSTGAGGAPDGG